MQDLNYKIYKITNLINNKIYIGLTKNSIQQRFEEHCAFKFRRTLLKNAIQKHGKINFKVELLEENILSFKDSCKREIFYIKQYNATDRGIGYNISDGGGSNIVKYSFTKELIINVMNDKLQGLKAREIAVKDNINKYSVRDILRFKFSKDHDIDENLINKIIEFKSKDKRIKRINKTIVENIINDYIYNNLTQEKLAIKYQYSIGHISAIINSNTEGKNNKNKKHAKLKENDIINIFNDYSSGNYSFSSLSKKYNVNCASTISDILSRKNWSFLEIDNEILEKCNKVKDNLIRTKEQKINLKYNIFLDFSKNISLEEISKKYNITIPLLKQILSNSCWLDIELKDDNLKNFIYDKKKQINSNVALEIIKDYLNGLNINSLIDKYSTTKNVVNNVLKRKSFKKINLTKEEAKLLNEKVKLEYKYVIINKFQVIEIFNEFATGNYNFTTLGKKFNCGRKVISSVLKRESYKDIEIDQTLLDRVNKIINEK